MLTNYLHICTKCFIFLQSSNKKSDRGAVGVRAPYMRVIGIEVETDGTGRASRDLRFTPDEEEEFRRLAAKPDVHNIISRFILSSKAIAHIYANP